MVMVSLQRILGLCGASGFLSGRKTNDVDHQYLTNHGLTNAVLFLCQSHGLTFQKAPVFSSLITIPKLIILQ